MPTLAGTEVPCKVWDLTTGADSHLATERNAAEHLVERHLLMPSRHVRLEAQCLDLRLERHLRVGVAMDEEHGAREAGVPGVLSCRESADPIQQLALVSLQPS